MSMLLEPQAEKKVAVLDQIPAQSELEETESQAFARQHKRGLLDGRLTWTWEHLALLPILLLSAFFGLWGLVINGYSNDFYASAVKSMVLNWHNFFFASFDPGGFVTVDKPPVALWFEVLSAKIFGFSGVSLLLPEALAGIAGVALLYFMVKRAFGTTAGLISALVLAVTPIFVVMNRDNNPDSMMVLFLMLSAWAWLKAARTGRLRWLLLGSLLVGINFNIKTLEAIVILPAFYALYFLLANVSWKKRIAQLIAATLVVLVVSFSWSVAVDLTPASSRPYVGGSTNNSELNLIFGYNGLGRVDAAAQTNSSTHTQPTSTTSALANGSVTTSTSNSTGTTNTSTGGNTPPTSSGSIGGSTPPTNGGTTGSTSQTSPFGGSGEGFRGGSGSGGGNAGPTMGGTPGLFRFLDQTLVAEFGWFLPLALLGLGFAAVQTRFAMKKSAERRERLQSLMVWGGWLLLYGAVFSFSTGTSHSYYLTALAPAQAALVGIGIVAMWKSYRKGGWQAWFLPVSLAVAALFQAYIVAGLSNWNTWLAPVLVVLAAVSFAGLALNLIGRKEKNAGWSIGVVAISLAGLLIVPAALSIRAIFTAITGSIPSAVPGGGGMGGGFGGPNDAQSSNISSTVIDFVKANLTGQIYVAIAVIAIAAVIMVATRLLRNRKLFTLRRIATVALLAFLLSSGVLWFQAGQAQAANSTASAANSDRFGMNGGGNGGGNSEQVDTALLQYVEANQDGYTYLFAVNSSMGAAPYILETGEPVMAMGGFSGSDQILTVSSLEQLIKNHTVRYFVVGGQGGGQGGDSSVNQWITSQCKAVSYSSSTTTSVTTSSTTNTTATTSGSSGSNGGAGFGGFGAQQQDTLYDCSQAVS